MAKANGQGDIFSVVLNTGASIAGAAARAAVDAAVVTVDAAKNASRPGLLRQPRNIKEALEWLVALEQEDGAEKCVKVIKEKILGNTNGNLNGVCQKLCSAAKAFMSAINQNGGTSYTSTYQGAQQNSAYDSASWSELCTPGVGGKCCGNNDCGCQANNCHGCCYDCPQIICARMFCMIVPIVYYFLEYLNEKCQGEWKDQKADGSGSGTEFKNFLVACGFNSVELNGNKKGCDVANVLIGITSKLSDLKDALKKAFKNTKSPTTSLATTSHNVGTKEPSTIRDMMLWLQGLPYCPQFHGLKTKIKEKCEELNNGGSGVTCENFSEKLFETVFRLPGLFLTVEGKFSHLLRDLLEGCFGYTNEQCFMYNNNAEQLFKQFCDYTYKVHTQLRFLMTMCNTEKTEGGWLMCDFGNGVNGKAKTKQGAHTCSCNGTNANVCSQPLKAFLTANSSSSRSNSAYQNGICMGFDSTKLTKESSNGWYLYVIAKGLIDEITTTASASSQSPSTSKPLSLLTQYCVAIGQIEPDSLGDHFDVFQQLAKEDNGMWNKIKGEVQKDIKGITTTDAKGETASDKLKAALKAVWPSAHNGTHPSDLRSLTGCGQRGSSQSCTPFIASLSYGLYQYFIPKMEGQPQPPSQGPSKMIDWLYIKMSGLYGKLKKLLEEMKKACQCCPEGEASKDCKGIIQCPNCLPLLYKMGLVFGDAKELNYKTCSELHTVMGDVLDATSKLCVVFKEIDDKRFWPYLLFSAMVVHGKKDQLQVNGDDNYNCYTVALGDEVYTQYLTKVKETDTQAAGTNKTARDGALKCACSQHSYRPLTPGNGTPITVTLTLYFQGAYINTAITLVVPHHGPLSNPLVRFYPRNLKSIVDWLLRIGQTRLGQGTKEKGVEEMCDVFWPEINKCVEGMDNGVFQKLVTGVVKLMGLQNQGKNDVKSEVTEKLKEAKQNIQTKLNGNGDDFATTFEKILNFNSKSYIDKVIKDFGERVCTVSGKQRSYWCIAKSVSTCMKDSLDKIKQLAEKNKEALKKYNSYTQQDIKDISNGVTELNTLGKLKELCDAFSKFYTSCSAICTPIEGVLDNLKNDSNGGKTLWEGIQKYITAFYYISEVITHVKRLERDSTMGGSYDSLEILIQKLTELERHNGSLNGNGDKVTEFIKKVQDKLTEIGKENIEKALNIKNGSTKIDDVVKMFLGEVFKTYHSNATILDKIFYHPPVFSECLKAMVEIYNTGMKEFITELKTCLETAKDHINKIHVLQMELKELKDGITYIKDGDKKYREEGDMESNFIRIITTIEQFFKNQYIYNPPIIVSTLITDTSTMTTYLKSLPDLIRDRYVLQKWHDSPEAFCGVQSFDNGIVKKTDTDGIKKKLQELLEDTYHNATSVTIHDFQVRSLIYNFCHKEAMENIIAALDVMESVKKVLGNVNQDPPKPPADVEWTNINSKKQQLLSHLTSLSTNPYLKYFAGHLRDSTKYYALCNRGITHPLSPNLANAKTIYNYIRATQ